MMKLLTNLAKVLGVIVPVVGTIVCGRLLAPYLPQFAAWVETLGVWGPLAFVVVYILAVVCLMPAFLLQIAGGAVFGLWRGFFFSLAGALSGGIVAFLVSRYLIRNFVARKIASNSKLVALDRIIGDDGYKLVFLLRLSPVIPFVLSNYALGVTRVKFSDFVIGTLGLTPIVLSYAALGSAAGAVDVSRKSNTTLPLVIVGISATVVLGLLVARIVQRAIASAENAVIAETQGA